jgi:uncharacterized membrane protein YczE/predicted metal-binding protein
MIKIEKITSIKRLIPRIIAAIVGISLLSLGISFMRYALFGVDPMSCFNVGMARRLDISFGTWMVIICFIMLFGVFFSDKSKIGFGTVYVMLLCGYTSDFFLWLIELIPFLEFTMEYRIAALVLGLFFNFFGAAVYIESNMGLSPYDAVAIIISEKIKREHWFRWIRIGTDALCVFGGFLTKSDIGVGTLITVVICGPCIAFFRKHLKKFKIFQVEQSDLLTNILKEASASVNVPVHEQAQIPTTVLVFSPALLEYCKTNACGCYNKSWTCPPACGSINEQQKKILAHKNAFVFTTKHEIEDPLDHDGMTKGREHHALLTSEIKKMSGNFLVYGAGQCHVCENCSFPEPCLFIEKQIGSIEAAGIDVSELSKAAGVKYNNGENTVTFFSMLLL